LTTSSFYASILTHAQQHPTAIAIHDDDRAVTYAQFVNDIDRITRRLNSLALPEHSRAAIHVHDPYLHWLVVIGLWRIGILSMVVGSVPLPVIIECAHTDILVMDGDRPSEAGGRFIGISAQWLNDPVDALPAFQERVFAPDHPVWICLSSGTTGTPKKILLTESVIDARLERVRHNSRVDASLCFMSLVSLASVEFFFSVAMWSIGGAVQFQRQPLASLLTQGTLKANLLFMNPAQLNDIVNALPADRRPDPSLRILVGGGVLPKEVCLKANARLSRFVMVMYGSTETGSVAVNIDPAGNESPGVCGYVVRDMEVQIVDVLGQPVPNGAQGEVRMRSTSCVSGYLDDPKTSSAMFRDGWFYPGDMGVLEQSGLLTIVGRIDDVMNLGGRKISPSIIEETLFSCPGIKDLAAFSMTGSDGMEEPWVALIAGQGYALERLSALWNLFGVAMPLKVAHVDAIPRNDMGKVLRDQLREQVNIYLSAQANGTLVPSDKA